MTTNESQMIDDWIRHRAKKTPRPTPAPPPPTHRRPVNLAQGDIGAEIPVTPKPTVDPNQWLRAVGRVKARVLQEAIEDELSKEMGR